MKITISNVLHELKKRQAEQDRITREIARLGERQKKLTESTQQLFHDICQNTELAIGLARAIDARINPGSEGDYLNALTHGEPTEQFLKQPEGDDPSGKFV